MQASLFQKHLNLKDFCSWEQKNEDDGGKDIMKKHRRQVLFSGIITAIGQSAVCIT